MTVTAEVERHELGITWMDPGRMARTAHALNDAGRVWLIDPFDDEPALREAAALGRAGGVLQLLDRHSRDCEAIATRLGVQLMRLPTRLSDAPFEIVPVISRHRWREIALWWRDQRALIVAEAIGTAPAFALGRRAGVHPMLRLIPPRSQLSAYRPAMLLVGHGMPIMADAASALDEALACSRSDIPRLLTSLPGLLRDG